MADVTLTPRQREVLEVIDRYQRERGYPPSVREIGEAVGLTSPSTVHAHLGTLQKLGFLVRDPTKPRAIEVRFDATSGGAVERRPVRHVPLVGDVAAGTNVLAQENIEDAYPVPAGDRLAQRSTAQPARGRAERVPADPGSVLQGEHPVAPGTPRVEVDHEGGTPGRRDLTRAVPDWEVSIAPTLEMMAWL